MLEAFEPLVATILSVTLLGSDFGIMKMAGGVLIILATCLQVVPSPRRGKLQRNLQNFLCILLKKPVRARKTVLNSKR
jgi:drug/metabolite transporter (DMT)-like permease